MTEKCPLFDDGPRESCGIAAVYSKNIPAMPIAADAQRALDNRGQQAYGAATRMGETVREPVRKKGEVGRGYTDDEFNHLGGQMAIVHNRYSTRPDDGEDMENTQPLYSRDSHCAIGHNGNIPTGCYSKLRKEIEKSGYKFETTSDTEVLLYLLASCVDIVSGFREISTKVRGSWSVVVLNNDGIYAARDPQGIKPLCLGRRDGVTIVASESSAFYPIGAELERSIVPGEILHITPDGSEESTFLQQGPFALDIFEIIYFANPHSVIDGICVSDARFFSGRLMARHDRDEGFRFGEKGAIAVPYPNSGIYFTEGYAYELGIPVVSGLYRSRTHRSFIQGNNELRKRVATRKVVPIHSMLENQICVVGDDSLVRGVTAMGKMGEIRSHHPKELHLRLNFPPITHPCDLGIDMKTSDEHFAFQVPDIGERERKIGVDSLRYLPFEDLFAAIAMARRQEKPYGKYADEMKKTPLSFCTHCFSGIHPFSQEFPDYAKTIQFPILFEKPAYNPFDKF